MRGFWRGALAVVRAAPGLFLAAVLSVALALFMLGAFYLGGKNLKLWSERFLGVATLVVYFKPEVSEARARTLASQMKALPAVSDVSLTSPTQAASELAELFAFAEVGDKTSNLPAVDRAAGLGETLTWSAEVTARDQATLAPLAALLRAWPEVEDLDAGGALRDKVEIVARIIDLAFAVFMAVVLAVAVFIINMTVSLSLYARREEIQIQKIVGASDLFVLLPLVAEAAFAGLLGGGAAVLMIFAGFDAWRARLGTAFAALGFSAPVFLGAAGVLRLLALGVAISVLGTLLASFRHLRTTE